MQRVGDDFKDRICRNHNKHADEAPDHVALAVLCPLAYPIHTGQKLNHTPHKHQKPRRKDECEDRVYDYFT